MLRKLTAVPFALVLLLVLAPTAAATEARNVGTAKTSIDLLDLKVDLSGLDEVLKTLPLQVDQSLGLGQSFASNDLDPKRNLLGGTKPFALAELELPVVGKITARSDGQTRQAGKDVALPAGVGALKLGGLQASVDGTTASSLIDLLNGNITAALAGIKVEVPAEAVRSRVNLQDASALNGAQVTDLSIKLGDLLPLELLEQLPLPVLLELLNLLKVDTGALGAVLDTLDAVAKEIRRIQVQLPTLTQQAGTITGDLNAVLNELDQALGAGSLTQAQLNGLIVDLDGLGATAEQLIGQLRNLLAGLLDVIGVLESLEINELLENLLGDLANLELLGIDRLTVGLTADASAAASKASVLCQINGVRVLGAVVPEVDTCGALESVLVSVDSLVFKLIRALPVVGNITSDIVTLEGLRATTSPANAVDGRYRVAEANLTALKLELKSVELDAVAGGLVAELTGLLQGLLGGSLPALLTGNLGVVAGGQVGNLLGGQLSQLLAGGLPGVVGGLDVLTGRLEQIQANNNGSSNLAGPVGDFINNEAAKLLKSSVSRFAVDLGGVLGLLQGVLDLVATLPLGDLLGNLATPALSLEALKLTAASQFATPLAVTPPPAPTVQAQLPKTGGDTGGIALLLLVIGGAGTVFLVRRRVTAG